MFTQSAFAIQKSFTKADVDSNTFNAVIGTKQASIKSTHEITKGDLENLPLTSSYQKAGVYLTLYAMGNNPALDCQITGYFEPA